MRVTARSDYALRALVELARAADLGDGAGSLDSGKRGAGPLSAETIGRTQEIPHGFLQSILADLRRAGIVASQRGQSGGWRLARPAAEVTVADVLRVIDGPLVSLYDVQPEHVDYAEGAEVLQHVWIAARAALRRVMEQVTLADLADGALPPGVEELTRDEGAWSAR